MFAGLSDRLLHNFLKPITDIEEISFIYIVRDKPGIELKKVIYRCPPRFSLKLYPLKFLFKFLIAITISLKERIDYIHSFLLYPNGFLALILSKIFRKKVSVSLIAGPVELFTIGRSPIGKYNYAKEYPLLNRFSRFSLGVLKRMDFITVTGSYTQKFLIKQGLSLEKIIILIHTVDDRFKPLEIKKEYDFIFIGRIVKVKRVHLIIRSIKEIKKSYPHVKLAIVGDGKEKYNLERLVKDIRLNENIRFLGYKEDVWYWYNNSKYSVLMSEREGFPFSVIESMKCGIPVIGSRCGDIVDIIKHNINGVLIEKNDDEFQLAAEMIKLLSNHNKYQYLSKNALETIEKISDRDNTNIWRIIFNATEC